MDPKLIECAARLCGWRRLRPEDASRSWYHEGLCMTHSDEALTDAGLLALEDALLRRGWNTKPFSSALGYRWVKGKKFAVPNVCDQDRATAACLAAQKALEEGK
jgi:hypothetical protein